jgi:hypothetical protein
MNLHLLAVDVKPSEYEWQEPATKPKPQTVKLPGLFMPELFQTDILKWSEKYAASLLSNPEWQRKQEEKAERRRQREERTAERRQRRSKAA